MRIGIIGGSGMAERLGEAVELRHLEPLEVETPFGRPSGPIMVGEASGVPIALLRRHGERHTIPPHRVPYRANIFALKSLGVTHVVATGAVGSLREEFRPGELVLCDQLLDRTSGRERTFFDHAAVHVEFADPFCPVVRQWLGGGGAAAAGGGGGAPVHERGTYIAMDGPSFSTRAESHMHRMLGADLVGMTALPEARLAREAEIAYALVALVTDYDCWRPRETAAIEGVEGLLVEIMANIERATHSAMALIAQALKQADSLGSTPSPAHTALQLAIWTRKDAIDREEVERLRPIWGRHFNGA